MNKLAILALVGVASTYNLDTLQTLPEWAVDNSAQCNNLVTNEAKDLGNSISALPKDKKHELAALKVAKFLSTIPQLCHETQKGFYCPDSAEKELTDAAKEAIQALADCHSPQANQVIQELSEFFAAVDKCTHKIGNFKVMIKVELPPAGQQALQKEVQEFQFESRKFQQSPQAQQISQSFQKWTQSPEFHEVEKTVKAYERSGDGRAVEQQLNEAIRALERNTKEIPNGFQINNQGLPEIQREFEDVDRELQKLSKTHWNNDFDRVFKNAFEQADFQAGINQSKAWSKTQDGQKLGKEFEDIGEALDKHIVISDLPQH